MQPYQPCKIELKWPACCPRCGLDLRVSPEVSSVEPFSPATIILNETAKRLAQKIVSEEKPSEEDAEQHLDLAIIVGNQVQKAVEVPVPLPLEQKLEPITLPLTGRIEIASKGEAKIMPPTTEVPIQPPLPVAELKQETPPPPPPSLTPSVSEPVVVIVKEEPEVQEMPSIKTSTANQAQSISQYYGLLPTPTQVTFTPQIQQVGQLTFNAPPPMLVPHQQSQQPVWTSQQPQQINFNPCYQASSVPWYRPPPTPVLVQHTQPVPAPRYVQYPTPPPAVNFPFPPPNLAPVNQPPLPAIVSSGNGGVFTVQHHFLNVMPHQQQQQQQGHQGQQFQ